MKVVYVGNFDTLSVGEPEIARALVKEGCEVITISQQKADKDIIIHIVERENPDILLFAKLHKAVATPYDIADIYAAATKVLKVCWLFDLYFGL